MERRAVAVVAGALALSNLVGSIVARPRALRGRPLGVGWPPGWPGELTLWGTGISAPFALDLALLVLAGRATRPGSERAARRALAILGATVVAGHLVEPATYRWPTLDAGARRAVAVNLTLCALLVATARPSR